MASLPLACLAFHASNYVQPDVERPVHVVFREDRQTRAHGSVVVGVSSSCVLSEISFIGNNLCLTQFYWPMSGTWATLGVPLSRRVA